MNAPVPQRIKMMTVEQLRQRVIALEAANAKCGEAIAAAVQAEREANRIQLETAARQLRSIGAYANTLPRRYAAGLYELCGYGDIEAAAIRARSGAQEERTA